MRVDWQGEHNEELVNCIRQYLEIFPSSIMTGGDKGYFTGTARFLPLDNPNPAGAFQGAGHRGVIR